jgi:radical SAM superfamily enzyme YgiQ (UPF0313 family)
MEESLILIKLPEGEGPLMRPTFTPPIGLWSMRENNPEISMVFDGHLYGREETLRFLYKRSSSDLLCFSLQFHTQEKFFREILPILKADEVTIGGPHGSMLKIKGVRSHQGPGERGSFKDLFFPHPTEAEMSPYWRLESPFGKGDPRRPSRRPFPIETSRGCPNSCDFCMMNDFWAGWVGRDPEKIKEYLKWLRDERGIDEVIILDDNISLDRKRFLSLLEIFRKEGMKWRAPNGIYLRSIMQKEVLESLLNSNCTGLSLPFETGTQKAADLMTLGRKWLNPEEQKRLVSSLQDLHLTGFFIIGYPGETEEDVLESLSVANSLPLNERHIYLAAPYPGSSLYQKVKRMGWLKEEELATYRNASISTPFLSSERLLEIFNEDRNAALLRKKNETPSR